MFKFKNFIRFMEILIINNNCNRLFDENRFETTFHYFVNKTIKNSCTTMLKFKDHKNM